MFTFSKRSLDHLEDVHPDLVKVMHAAIAVTPVDFGILEGLRTLQRQKELVAKGASKTMHSRHLTGKAVDYGVYVDGNYVNGDTPEEQVYYKQVAEVIKAEAAKLNIHVVWGGDWTSFVDMDHIELDPHFYPDDLIA